METLPTCDTRYKHALRLSGVLADRTEAYLKASVTESAPLLQKLKDALAEYNEYIIYCYEQSIMPSLPLREDAT